MRISDWSSDVCSSDLFIRQALETIRHDLAKALQAFGFDSSAIQNFSKAFVEPVLSALKEGVNFTAELSFAAFSQVTTLSSNRPEERRVGKGCVSTCKSRWSSCD